MHSGASRINIEPTPNGNPKTMAEEIKKFNKKFEPDVFLNGITIPKLATLVTQWAWDHNPNKVGWAKSLLDEYDFDGDGVLNPSEFIFLSVWNNKKGLGGKKMKNLFNEIIETVIDPIFAFLDCDSDGLISSENMWEGLKNLKRCNGPQFYNMYKCVFPNGHVRTASTNDVVLKSMESVDGFLNKEEFRRAILLGYWDRQTDKFTIIQDDNKTMKDLRWADKLNDIVCDKMNGVCTKNDEEDE